MRFKIYFALVIFSLIFFVNSNTAIAQTQDSAVYTDPAKSQTGAVYKKKYPTKTSKNSKSKKKQITDSSSLREFVKHLTPGGFFNFGISNGSSYLEVDPLIGYKWLNDKMISGVGATYIQYWFSSPGIPTRTTSIFGGRLFTNYEVFQSFFLHTEIEALNWAGKENYYGEKVKIWSLSPLVGGGIRQKFSERGSFNLYLLYNLAYNAHPENFPYTSPLIIRAGFFF